MTTIAIIKEIGKLPLTDKLLVIEKALKAIRQEKEHNLINAVNALHNDYASDKELTIFSQIDSDPFYETR